MATALKLKKDINKLKAALRSKATPKSFIPKLKSQLEKAEADYESVKAGKKAAPKKASKQVKSTMDKLKAIVKKKKYGAYRAQGVDLKKDADRPALPTGKRISKNGNTYYEYRANRIDVKQPPKRYPKLEDGGEIKNQYEGKSASEVWNSLTKSQRVHFLVDHKDHIYKYGVLYKSKEEREELANKKYDELSRDLKLAISDHVEDGQYGKGGYMAGGGDLSSIKKKYEENEDSNAHSENVVLLAKHFGTKEELAEAKKILSLHEKEGHLSSENGKKRQALHLKLIEKASEEMNKQGIEFAKGGETKPYIIWVSKDGEKREFYGTYKSQRAAEMAMNKLWDNGDYKAMGNKPKDMYEKEGFYKDGGYLAVGGMTAGRWYTDKNGEELRFIGKIESGEYKDKLLFSDGEKKVYRTLEDFEGGRPKENKLFGLFEDGGMTPLDVNNQIWEITARIAELGNVNTQAAYEETKKLMEMRAALQARALHLADAKMAKGGELHRTEDMAAKGMFVKSEFTEILDESVSHLYQGLNQLDLAIRYLEVSGQGGAVSAFKKEVNYDALSDSIKKIEEKV